MIHPDTELRFVSPTIGYGVFAKRCIPMGTIVYAKDELETEIKPGDPLLTNPLYKSTIEKYSYIDADGNHIISWDIAKFVNHCCNCNTMSTGYGFEIAIRDIQPGEEITDEYGILNMREEIKLSCSYTNCRKQVLRQDFDKLVPEWDEKIRVALQQLYTVDQPLLKFLDAQSHRSVNEYLTTGQGYVSVQSQKLGYDCRRNRKLYRIPKDLVATKS